VHEKPSLSQSETQKQQNFETRLVRDSFSRTGDVFHIRTARFLIFYCRDKRPSSTPLVILRVPIFETRLRWSGSGLFLRSRARATRQIRVFQRVNDDHPSVLLTPNQPYEKREKSAGNKRICAVVRSSFRTRGSVRSMFHDTYTITRLLTRQVPVRFRTRDEYFGARSVRPGAVYSRVETPRAIKLEA